ncbi:hypothetical protein [Vitiosangium sp. GDMCC 1.1324]|uniref:hypothetical protein n=1 Tax=Vitiosangium sp. (strain GDMCC 1.1324) TaxID=2138576 RepID=UPI000D35DB69|nr:hypothetical protein [Vitiosangium sp. GDMCC 1.1324]PTL78020.1 hypothetical protein DAT35_41085 [Vitiosangium sp. GDMCC 1.1324]
MSPFIPEALLVTARSDAPFSPVVALVLFAGMWVLSCTVMSWVTGHRALLVRYPPVDELVEKSFHFASGHMRWGVSFHNALYVGIGTAGVHLAPNGLFRSPFFRGIPCIPWSELHCVRPQEDGLFGWPGVSRFEVPALNLRISIRGEPGRAIEGKLALLSVAGR